MIKHFCELCHKKIKKGYGSDIHITIDKYHINGEPEKILKIYIQDVCQSCTEKFEEIASKATKKEWVEEK